MSFKATQCYLVEYWVIQNECSVLTDFTEEFSKEDTQIYIPPVVYKSSTCSKSLQLSFLKMFAILVDV